MVPFYFLCVCAANLALYFVIKHAPDSVSPQGITFAVSMLMMLVRCAPAPASFPLLSCAHVRSGGVYTACIFKLRLMAVLLTNDV